MSLSNLSKDFISLENANTQRSGWVLMSFTDDEAPVANVQKKTVNVETVTNDNANIQLIAQKIRAIEDVLLKAGIIKL